VDATITRISDAVASERGAVAHPADTARTGLLLEITRFDSFAAQPTAMAQYSTACFGGAAA
jgi:hypothetical protein